MRLLIANADDFGVCEEINRGIIASHKKGIVTSTSIIGNAERSALKEYQ